MSVQIIKTERGEQLAILPLAEYEQLLDLAEERVDIADCDVIMKQLKKGDEIFSEDLVKALITEPSAIAVLRKYRDLTMEQLAEKAGVSKSYISKLECGDKKGSVETLKKLADALDVDVDWLL